MNTPERTITLAMPKGAQRAFLADNLAADGYDADTVDPITGLHALRHLTEGIVLLGAAPARRRDALALLADLRCANAQLDGVDPDVPVLVLGQGGSLDCLRAFDAGADDYIAVPFSYAELRARVAVALRRRATTTEHPVIRIGELAIDLTARRARIGDHDLQLSRLEFDLLRTLATDPTRVFTKDELARTVWGHPDVGRSRTVDSHCCRLRQKLQVDGRRAITNVWGVGYRLMDA